MAQEQAQPSNPVEAIQAILAAERTAKEPPKEAAPPKQETPEVKEETPAVEAQPQPEAPTADNAQVEGAELKEIPEDQLEAIELEVKQWSKDGKRIPAKLTIKELREGYMRLDDYSRNIQEVARQRDEVPQKIREGIEGERKNYLEGLQQLNDLVMQTAAAELKDVNWNDLAANDPAKYVQYRNRADQLNVALQAIKAKKEEVEAKARQEQGEARKKAAREARAQLEADIPNFSDDLYRNVLKVAEKFGYRMEEVGEWIDPRAIKLLHAVYEYDQLKPGKPAEKKVVIPPKVVKPGAASTVTPSQKRDAEAMKRLQSSGRIEDAAAVIRSRL